MLSSGNTSASARARTFDLALIILLLLVAALSPEPGAAQNAALAPLEATINLNAVMRQELSSLPTTQRPLRNRLGEPIAGVAPEKLAETRIRLSAVEFEGPADVHLDPAILQPAWQGSIGKVISLHEVGKVLERIEDLYRQQDYVVIAKVPPQDFASGRVRIVAYSVYVRDIEVRDDVRQLRRRLDPIFVRIKAMRPLHISALYRQLLLAEDLAGGEINAEWFQIENAPGAARLELTIASRPSNILLSFDNYGSETTGPLQASARAYANDALGLFESTDITALTNPAYPARLALLGLAQTVPLGTNGFSLGYGIANSWSNPAGSAADEGLHSKVLIANIGINYALLREMERNVTVTATLNANDSSVDKLGEVLTRDRTRWVSVGAKYDDVIGNVRIVLNPVLLQGVNAFQANVSSADFQVATLNGRAATNLTDTLSAQLLLSGQYALNNLPAAVLGFYGGEIFGRAYDPGALAGKHLAAAAFQLAQQIDTGLSWLPKLSLFAFSDYGAAWNQTRAPYEFASLSSAGLGLSAGIGERLNATALAAQPLTHDSELAGLGVEQSTRLRFTLSLRF